MTRSDRLHRVLLACCHFTANNAYFYSGLQNDRRIRKEHFWVKVNGNFLEIAILEWCKLFGEPRGLHDWRKVVTDKELFTEKLNHIFEGSENYEQYARTVRGYRDKFIAHLDNDTLVYVPPMELAQKCVYMYFNHILEEEEKIPNLDLIYARLEDLYSAYFKEGRLWQNDL